MDNISKRSIAASIAILAATIGAFLLTPKTILASDASRIDLATMLPDQFKEWRLVPDVKLVDSAPDALANQIYSQSVGRAFVDPQGDMVMLLVAYGPNQSEGLQLHRPEICYVADGYTISEVRRTELSYQGRSTPLPTTHVSATRESRSESIVYWMRVGDDIAQGVIGQQIMRIKYGLRGQIPDGVLVRVSTVVANRGGYDVENRFVSDLLDSVSPETRTFLIGSKG